MDSFCNKIPYALDILTWKVVEVDDYNVNNKWKVCCPYCKNMVIFRWSHTQNIDWTWRKKHFSHNRNSVCVNKVSSEWESLAHRESKDYIFNLLKSINNFSSDFKIINLSKEFQFINEDLSINRIADIYFEFTYKNKVFKQAYEIQYSNITEEEFAIRHNDYKKLWIQDIWFVWLQYKNNKDLLENISGNEIYNDNGCYFVWDTDSFYCRIEEVGERPFLKKIITPFDSSKMHINKKSISLYNKISSFQNIIYLISANWLYLPKTIDTSFVCAKWWSHYQKSYFFTLKDFNDYKDKKTNNFSFPLFEKYFKLKLAQTKNIGINQKYNYNLVNILSQELNELFFINGDNNLFHISDSELKYANEKINEFQSIINEKEKVELFELDIQKYKYIKSEYAKIYFIRLIAKFIWNVSTVIENTKGSVRNKTWDSLQWINRTLLTQEWKDKNRYWFFSSINKVLENMAHIIPNIFIRNIKPLLESINNIITFLDQVECDFYDWVDYDFFIKEFNNSLYIDLCRSYNYKNNKFKWLNEDFFYYWLVTALKGYCLSEIKKDINFFMYQSIFWNNKNDLENRIRLEHKKIIEFNNELMDIYC